jgi:hypothetical protein
MAYGKNISIMPLLKGGANFFIWGAKKIIGVPICIKIGSITQHREDAHKKDKTRHHI